MSELVIPNRFRDGEALSNANIDANFTAVATLLNTTKLGDDNFRDMAGITNSQKSNPYSIVPAVVVIPRFKLSPTVDADDSVTYSGMWACPMYHQGYYSGAQGTLPEATNGSRLPFYISSIQGCYHGVDNYDSADTMTASIYGRREGETADSLIVSDDIFSNNTLVTATPASEIPLAYAYLVFSAKAVKRETPLSRTWYNIVVTIWCKMPHVAAGR